MNDPIKRAGEVIRSWGDALRPVAIRLRRASRSRRLRRAGLIVVAVVAVLGLALVVAVPPILRHVLTVQVATSLKRPVRVGRIGFNPLNLRLDVDNLHVGERDAPNAFVDVGHLRVKASWFSIFRLAPVVREVTIERPAFHVVRIDEQHFNFTDLLQSPGPPPAKPPPPSTGAPMRFAVSNIRVTDGDIRFEDKLLGQTHHVEKIKLNVPFIANLPADVEVYVQPLLQMVVDGSLLRIAGVTKPFGATHDSVVDLKLHRLDLPLYLGYAPLKLPVRVQQGTLSSDVFVHFVQAAAQPMIRLNGAVALDTLDVRDLAGGPLLELKHGEVKLKDVEPLGSTVYLEAIRIDGLRANVVRNADGTTNLSALTAGAQAPAKSAPASAAPATSSAPPAPLTEAAPAATPAPAAKTPAMDFSLDNFELTDSVVKLADRSGATPAALALDGIHVSVLNLRNSGQRPATYDISAKIRSGGALGIKGDLDLVRSQINSDVALDGLDLPPLQPFAQNVLAATIPSGKFTAHAKVATHFASDQFNVHAEPAGLTLDNFRLLAPGGRETPVEVSKLSVAIGQVDLASHNAVVNEIRTDGLHLSVRRGRNGLLSLTALVRTSEPATPRPRGAAVRVAKREAAKPIEPTRPPGPSWQFRIESVAMDKTEIRAQDDASRRPVTLALAPIDLSLKGVSSDFSKPFSLDLSGTLNSKGTFKIDGTVAIAPLSADLKIATQRLDLSFADAYVSSGLNATVTSAMLTMDGAAHAAEVRKSLDVSYRGDATLGNVTMLDKLTGDQFLKWNAFSARKIDFSTAGGPPKMHIGELALSNFYSRIILDSSGKLNLKNIMASPETAQKSLTRAAGEPGAQGAAPTPAPTPIPAAPPAAPVATQPIAADIALDRITLQGGKIDYTDDFIKPNYTANLTEIAGKIGAFGTKSTEPAEVSVAGQINGSAPINIDGSINPLAPMAFVDIKAKADGIELTGLTPYSAKYTGYPIVKGTLTVDVHYLLDQGKLTAANHIFIDQLTFGDHVESPNATNLPIRLAVSLLKNSRGQIDVNVPVSGSLSDPQFSIGSVVLGAFMNLIVKAATSPFTLLAAAFGGGSEDLGNIEFAPGWSRLTPDGQKKLDTVAAALQDRPALRLNISGRVDPEFDRDGFREAQLAKSIDALRAKDAGAAEDAGAESKPLSKDEYNKYLARVYSAGKFPKPRDVIGLAKSIPPDDMKKLILTNTAVTDDDLHHLADARANAVRRYLSDKKVDAARMFIIAPKLNASGITDKSKTTRVDLSLE